MAAAPGFLVGELGGAPYHGGPSGAYTFGQWRFAGGGVIEILEPLGADGFLHRFLAQRGPGIHHVTFRVPSLREACDRAEKHGYKIVGFDDSHREWQEAFLHPKQALGIVVQIVESEPARPGVCVRRRRLGRCLDSIARVYGCISDHMRRRLSSVWRARTRIRVAGTEVRIR